MGEPLDGCPATWEIGPWSFDPVDQSFGPECFAPSPPQLLPLSPTAGPVSLGPLRLPGTGIPVSTLDMTYNEDKHQFLDDFWKAGDTGPYSQLTHSSCDPSEGMLHVIRTLPQIFCSPTYSFLRLQDNNIALKVEKWELLHLASGNIK